MPKAVKPKTRMLNDPELELFTLEFWRESKPNDIVRDSLSSPETLPRVH